MEYIKCSEENPLPLQPLTIKGMEGYETYKIDENTIGVRPKWISIKNRLPSKYGYYLTYTPIHNFVSKSYSIQKYRYYPKKKKFWWFDGKYEINDGITHWMPLPEAPKE